MSCSRAAWLKNVVLVVCVSAVSTGSWKLHGASHLQFTIAYNSATIFFCHGVQGATANDMHLLSPHLLFPFFRASSCQRDAAFCSHNGGKLVEDATGAVPVFPARFGLVGEGAYEFPGHPWLATLFFSVPCPSYRLCCAKDG